MHARLERYLKEMEIGLRSLPVEQRESEMAEIRQHLAAMVDAATEVGFSEDEAVARALERFGKPREVGRQLARAHRRFDAARVGRGLCYAGWTAFLVSMFLPALSVLSAKVVGFQCALAVLSPSLPLTDPFSSGMWYYHALGLANVLMLASPVLLRPALRGRACSARVPAAIALAAASILPLLSSSGWEIGFYLWLASFVTVAAGSGFLAAARRQPIRLPQ